MNKKIWALSAIALSQVTNIFGASQAKQPNIVWIISEDNTAMYMQMFDKHGVATPAIEQLAEHGIIFNNAFSNAPVSSAARSTLISGCYGPRLASHYHRNIEETNLPSSAKMFPYYLKKAGYYTSNNSKEDYNIVKSDSVWDETSKKATWQKRKEGQPFFYMFNIETTHESRVQFTQEQMQAYKTATNLNTSFVQPNYPNTDLFKYTYAYYCDKIIQMDKEVGAVVEKLKNEGLLDNTFVFYFGDNGGVLPYSKGYLTETGLHVPLVVYIPPAYQNMIHIKPGTRTDGFVSFVDFGATVLDIAGIKTPQEMDGTPFLGKDICAKATNSRNETYGYADRMDEKYDMVRSLRIGQFKYVRNYQPFNFEGLVNNYRYKQLAYKEWKELYDNKKLNKTQSQFFEPKQAEGLYDVEKDSFETNNLAANPKYKKILLEMRNNLNTKEKSMPDLSFYPEYYLIRNAIKDPIAFGQLHKKEIQKYLEISNLMMMDYDTAKPQIRKSLQSNDTWERYWALIVCSSFGKKAEEFGTLAKQISLNDSEPINRVRAAEFLGLIKMQNPDQVMCNALYKAQDPAEILLILNSITLLKDGQQKYAFHIDTNKISKKLLDNKFVMPRIEYVMQ